MPPVKQVQELTEKEARRRHRRMRERAGEGGYPPLTVKVVTRPGEEGTTVEYTGKEFRQVGSNVESKG